MVTGVAVVIAPGIYIGWREARGRNAPNRWGTDMSDQLILFILLGIVFALLVWGKIRYDLVAFGALVVAIVIGVVPQEDAFAGFGHHATVIIALVLIVSRGLFNSGAIELIARHIVSAGRSLFLHISVMSGVSARCRR